LTLTFVKPPEHPAPNVFIYGPPKTGKTVGACSAPDEVLLLSGDTPNATREAHRRYGDRIHEVRFEGLPTMTDTIHLLNTPDHGFDVVVSDPVADFYRITLENLSRRATRPSIDLRGDTTTYLERFFRDLCERTDIATVIVAHETPVTDESTGVLERLPFTGTSNTKLASKILSMVDIIGYSGVKYEEGKDPEYLAQLINAGGRRGGDRFATLRPVEPMNLADWFLRIGGIETNTQPQEAVTA
jgi:hypothetical protein